MMFKDFPVVSSQLNLLFQSPDETGFLSLAPTPIPHLLHNLWIKHLFKLFEVLVGQKLDLEFSYNILRKNLKELLVQSQYFEIQV